MEQGSAQGDHFRNTHATLSSKKDCVAFHDRSSVFVLYSKAYRTERLSAAKSPEQLVYVRVDTVMIQGADHMYAGEEAQVAEIIAMWTNTVLPRETLGNLDIDR